MESSLTNLIQLLTLLLSATMSYSQTIKNTNPVPAPLHQTTLGGGGGAVDELAPKNHTFQNETGPLADALRSKRGYFYTYYTSRGYECDDTCARSGGTSYYWCRVSMEDYTWDYCSPSFGVDYYMRPCSTLCSYNGQKYRWCYVGQDKSWGYCSDSNAARGIHGPFHFSHFIIIFSFLSSILFFSV